MTFDPNRAALSARELVMELTPRVRDDAGTEFVVQVFGRERADGTWEGWLEFGAIDSARVLRTARETTQSKREDLVYWATGLEPTYLQGAFARATQLAMR